MIRIRAMKAEDAAKIEKLESCIFPDAWSRQSILESFGQPHAEIIIAEEDGTVIGYCILYYIVDECELIRIAVDKNARNQGVGRLLMEQAFFASRKKKMKKILLDVRESNETARKFYTACGFAEDGVRRGFYEHPGEDAVLMSREFR